MPHAAIPQPASNQNGRLRPRPRRDAPKQAAAARPLEKIWSALPSTPPDVDVPSVRIPTIWRPTTTHAKAINFRGILWGSLRDTAEYFYFFSLVQLQEGQRRLKQGSSKMENVSGETEAIR